MWLLNFLPNWLFHIIFIAGLLGLVASYILTFVPFVTTYKTPIQAASIITLIFAVFMEGAVFNNDAWQLKVSEAEKRALAAEAKAAEENVKIVTKIVEKVQVVRDTKVVIDKQIADNAAAMDAKCIVVPQALDILNKAAATPGGGK